MLDAEERAGGGGGEGDIDAGRGDRPFPPGSPLLHAPSQAMSSWLSPHTYLRDGSHPSRMFALKVGGPAQCCHHDPPSARSLVASDGPARH